VMYKQISSIVCTAKSFVTPHDGCLTLDHEKRR
jgi:hypothetical protein